MEVEQFLQTNKNLYQMHISTTTSSRNERWEVLTSSSSRTSCSRGSSAVVSAAPKSANFDALNSPICCPTHNHLHSIFYWKPKRGCNHLWLLIFLKKTGFVSKTFSFYLQLSKFNTGTQKWSKRIFCQQNTVDLEVAKTLDYSFNRKVTIEGKYQVIIMII